LIAIDFLERHGWRILEHRFKMGRLEVDLIASRDSLVAFVEVKTRGSGRFGDPVEAVTWSKRREIQRVARAWLDRRRWEYRSRFDVIGVQLRGGRPVRIRHIADAFRCDWR